MKKHKFKTAEERRIEVLEQSNESSGQLSAELLFDSMMKEGRIEQLETDNRSSDQMNAELLFDSMMKDERIETLEKQQAGLMFELISGGIL